MPAADHTTSLLDGHMMESQPILICNGLNRVSQQGPAQGCQDRGVCEPHGPMSNVAVKVSLLLSSAIKPCLAENNL